MDSFLLVDNHLRRLLDEELALEDAEALAVTLPVTVLGWGPLVVPPQLTDDFEVKPSSAL